MKVKLRKLGAVERLLAKRGDLRGVTIDSLPLDSAGQVVVMGVVKIE